jgi:DNA invertase Pin-like site-specific DNA recombinase
LDARELLDLGKKLNRPRQAILPFTNHRRHCMKKCAIYGRVSTPEQRIDNQLYDLRLFAEQRGYEVVAEYTDVGVSGSKARRPGLDSMLKDARKRKFGVVIVAAFDRIARSTRHFLSVIDELDGLGVEFFSRRENIATDGAMGRLFLTLISSIAELESDLIKERIRAGMRRRKLEGLSVGRQPLDVDHTSLVQDRMAGMSLTDVAKKYGVSRASVVRWVREASPQVSTLLSSVPVHRHYPEECAA